MNLTKKVCPPDKILNPISSRCVNKTSKLGKSILQQRQPIMQEPSKQEPSKQEPSKQEPSNKELNKQCPPDKILNHASLRCVSKTTKLGKSILQQRQPQEETQPLRQEPGKQEQRQEPSKQEQMQKQCPPDKILNPASLRCVSRTTKLGKSILQQRQSYHSNQSLKRNKASIIARFMKKTKHARRATALDAICSDSGVCIAFGTQSDKIKKFFNGFSSFDYVESFTMAGTPSNNGFIYAVNYKHRGYAAHAILKSSASPTADNLMYEYAVGKQINSLFYNKFPVFVETYDYYYKYPSEAMWRAFKYNTYTNKLKNALFPYDTLDYEMSCHETKHLCILIQHINNAPTLGTMCNSNSFIQTELINSLYQIYFTLSVIKNKFTHYDLHSDNVLVYTPNPNKYVEYHFHTLTGEVISFKSQHLVKIIDYGRSYVHATSESAYRTVCEEKSCKPNCGYDYGYWMAPNLPHFIHSAKHNSSHDLKLLNIINRNYLKYISKPKNTVEDIMYSELSKVIYTGEYGTAEIAKTRQPAKIANVSDGEIVLRRMLKSGLFKTTNNNYMSGYAKMGDLYVYADGRNMSYVSSE